MTMQPKQHMRRALGLATAVALGATAVHAATFNVNSTLDVPASAAAVSEGVCDDGEGQCTLRAAIQVADAASGPSTIVVPAGTYTLTVAGVDETAVQSSGVWSVQHAADPSRGDLNIVQSMTIVGAGSGQTVIGWAPGSKDDRVFHIEVAASGTQDLNVTLQGVTVQNGYVSAPQILDDSVPTAVVRLARMGGGIAIGAGAEIQTVDPTAVEGGEEDAGGCGGGGGSMGGKGCAGPEGHGGPGESESGATIQRVTLSDVQVIGNHSGGEGGGIYNTAPIVLDHVAVAGNSSDINGGGMYNDAAMLMRDSTIGAVASPNSAGDGGGLFETGFHTTVIERSAFVGNKASSGGAIAGRRMVSQVISRSTIADNVASDGGAAVMTNGRVQLINATVAGNSVTGKKGKVGAGLSGFGPASVQPSGGNANAANYTLVNTIVANNTFTSASPAALMNCGGKGEGDTAARFYSMGHNLEDGDSCGLHAAGDRIDVNPMLGPLANNGGATPTMALMAASPAVDAGDSAACPNEDERGQLGHADGNLNGTFECDIGAYELFVESADLHIEGVGGPDTVYLGDTFGVSATVHVAPDATAPSTGVQMTSSTLPSSVKLSSATVTTAAGTQSCAESSGVVTCNAGTLAPDETATMSLILSADAENSAADFKFSTTQASPVDPDPNNNAAEVKVDEVGNANLAVRSRGASAVLLGGAGYASFTVFNSGPGTATGVRLGVTLPGNATFGSIDLPGATCTYDGTDLPASVLCTLESIPPGQTLSGLLTVIGAADGSGSVTFAVDATQRDANLSDNQSLAPLSVSAAPAITDSVSYPGGGGCVSRPGGGFDPALIAIALGGGLGALLRGRRRTRARHGR